MIQGIVDFHSHILPEMDDGSRSVEESIAMLRMASEQGIRHVVATPHFYPKHDAPEQFLKRRVAAEAVLRAEMEKHSGLPSLSMGAEVYYFPGISNSEGISELAIDHKQHILIEMPMPPWTDAMYRELEGLYTKQGLIPIVAHLDRYIGRFRTFGIPARLAELPVLVQANAEFFLDRTTASMAMKLLKADQIQLLGTDCHNLADRVPNLGETVSRIEKKLGRGPIEKILSYETLALSAR